MNYKQIAVDSGRIMRIGKKLMLVLRKKLSPLGGYLIVKMLCIFFEDYKGLRLDEISEVHK